MSRRPFLVSKTIDFLKRSPVAGQLNRAVKSKVQEYRAHRDMVLYGRIMKKIGGRIVPVKSLEFAIRERRGQVQPGVVKSKGDLNIYVISGLADWESVLPKSLEAFGNVNTFMWESGPLLDDRREWISARKEGDGRKLRAFHEHHARKPIDIVVGYMTDYDTMPETVLEMQRAGALVANMCFDDKLYFSGSHGGCTLGVRALTPVVDLNLTNSPESMVKYTASGGLVMFWPGAAHPDIHKPHDLPFEFDVSFVGRRYGGRPGFIKGLEKKGVRVACFGHGWGTGSLSGEEMVKLYSRSRINLGFAGVGHSRKLMCLKGRDFEVPMCGGLYLTQDNPELSLVYDVGREIVTYENVEDCAGKIKRLLANPGEAAGIRDSGRKRALTDHTWEKRFHDLFRATGLME